MVFVVVGALRDPGNFAPLRDTCRLIAEGLDMEYGGVLVRPESHLTPFERSNPASLKRVRAAFVDAGREVGRTGRIPGPVQAAASEHLSADADSFRQLSDIYWEDVLRMGCKAMDLDECVRDVETDPRLILLRMVSSVHPSGTAGVEAVLQFDLTDPNVHLRVTIARGTAKMEEGKTADPDLRVCCGSKVLAAVAFGDMTAQKALADGLIELSGDRSLFLRLPRFFRVAN
jgi:hypothetical protein